MTEVIAFPDVEALLVADLTAELTARSDTADVATFIPNPRPARLVRVMRAGGPGLDIVRDAPTVIFDCWGTDETDAADLCRLVRALVWSLPARDGSVFRVREFAGPSNFPDPASANPRYRFTASLHTRGEAI